MDHLTLVPELLKSLGFVISEAKKVVAFESLSKDFASTLEDLCRIIKSIESMQEDDGELKKLKITIEKARVFVLKCLDVIWWDPITKAIYTRDIEVINKDMREFCQVQLHLIMHRNQMVEKAYTKGQLEILDKKLELLCVRAPLVFRDRCSVPMVDDKLLFAGKFKHIFFNVVSSTPNLRGLVENLFQHNGYDPLTFDNDSQATDSLRKLMEKLKEDGPILFVLDDVWHGAEFFLENFQDYKILVTSRFDFPSLCFTYHLKPLKDEDARSLLIQWASPPCLTYDDYEDLLRKILKRCDGFPLVIKVVGLSLKGLPLNLWKGQVESWSNRETLLGNPIVLQSLQPSFNALESHLQACFLDMGSFLEDQKIHAPAIIDIWMELYGKGSNSSSTEYMKYLHDLASHNLLKHIEARYNEENPFHSVINSYYKPEEDGFYNNLFVTQHDILRQLAIWQTKSEENHEIKRERLNLEIRDNEFPDWCLDLTQPIDARFLSISTDDLFSSNWVEMDCPNVEALVLNLSSSNYALPNFIATMKKLKVVIIINHGLGFAKLTNFSCLGSLPNLRRIRLEKVLIALLNIHQLHLESLKKLSLVLCSFSEVFYDVMEEIDISATLPRLHEIDIDHCDDLDELPYWICEVVSLKTLSITNCCKLSLLPEALGNLSKLEVLRLGFCTSLSVLPETMERLSELRLLDLWQCRVEKFPLEVGKLKKIVKPLRMLSSEEFDDRCFIL